jgi:hypothetical protein
MSLAKLNRQIGLVEPLARMPVWIDPLVEASE